MDTSTHPTTSAHDRPWLNTSLSPDERAALLLAQMTLEEKIGMVHGKSNDAYHIAPISRLGIPALPMTDGPAGINVVQATSLPAPIALAATWDLAAAGQYGELLGSEAEATGHNVFLAPCLDIARVPVYGRLFEALGEDPILTGQMAVRSIQSIQRRPMVATAKHYNVNAQEENRLDVDAQIDERSLQEIYTLPFALAVQDGHVGAAMGAFNKVNGVYCCENPHLLTDILKHQLGFTGWVMSDFEATHSTVEAANAGLDQEMPSAKFFGEQLLQAIQAGQVSLATLDDKVRRMLRTMFAHGLFEHLVQVTPLPVEEHGKQAREIAGKGIVLLKNAGELLPLSSHQVHSVAVIGGDAANYITGGGSSFVKPTYLVSTLEGIRRRAGEGVRVEYAEGVDPASAADLLPGPPLVPSSILTPAGSGPEVHGLYAEYWTNTRFEGEPRLVRTDRQVALNLGFFNFGLFNASSLKTPEEFNNAISVRWRGSLTAPATDEYTLSLTHLGTARLYLDGQLLIDDPGITLGTRSVTLQLVAGQPHTLQIDYAADRPEQHTPVPGEMSTSGLIGSKVRLGWEHPANAIPSAMQEAASLAARSDVAVVVVRDYRNEHADLPGLTLSNEQDLLIQVVAAANPRTIVVLATGGPALMPWLDQVPAVLESWYSGQEQGNALADVLFGDVNPSGKLPVTFPRSDADTPVSSPEQYSRTELVANFSEGLAVGYRGYDQLGIEPLFPFGYGLSYTSFAYAQLQVVPETIGGTGTIQVSFKVTNTGSRAGAEVAQVYLGLPASTGEPPRRLVGWAKVQLEPGETRDVSVTLDSNATSHPLSYWNVTMNGWEIASGDYQVYVGASSRDIRLTAAFQVRHGGKENNMTEWSEGNVQANGITIHYHRTGDNNKPSILLLHGVTDSGLCWSRVAHELEEGYDVIMTDARGHGRSGGSATEFSLALLADDAAAVIQALHLEKPFVLGHSMGAITAATLAATYPHLVRAIVLEDPPLRDKPQFQTNVDKSLFQTGGEQQNQFGWQWLFELRALPREERIARGFAVNPTWVEEEIIPWADSKAELNIDILEPALAAVSNAAPWREVISRIECPILLITGDPERGAIVTPEAAQEAAQLWKHGELVHIIGAGHNIRRDRYDETMAVVRAFLSRT